MSEYDDLPSVMSFKVAYQTLRKRVLKRVLAIWHAVTSSLAEWSRSAPNTSPAEPSWGSLPSASPLARGSVEILKSCS